ISVSLLVALARNHRQYLVLTQPSPHSFATVSFVSGQFLGSSAPADANRIHHRLDVLALMALTSRDFSREGHARAVNNQVELASPPASAAAQRVIRRLLRVFVSPAPAADLLARTFVPSMHHRSQSIRPSASSLIC